MAAADADEEEAKDAATRGTSRSGSDAPADGGRDDQDEPALPERGGAEGEAAEDEDNGSMAYFRFHKWCTKIGGKGVTAKRSYITAPVPPKRVADFASYVEIWEFAIRDLERLGKSVDPGTKMGGLRRLPLGEIKKDINVRMREFEAMDEEDAFNEMLEEVVNYATNQRPEEEAKLQ